MKEKIDDLFRDNIDKRSFEYQEDFWGDIAAELDAREKKKKRCGILGLRFRALRCSLARLWRVIISPPPSSDFLAKKECLVRKVLIFSRKR